MILEVAKKEDPIPGEDVYLSIRCRSPEKKPMICLEERIAGILLTYMSDTTTNTGSDIMIPIKEYYYALIDNNVISLSHLSADDADDREKSFWKDYKNYESSITSSLDSKMDTALGELDDEYKDYLLMTYSMLKDKSILNTGDLDDNDETLAKWNDGSISFNELLDYAITKDIVNISALNLKSDYLDTNEIYQALIEYVAQELPLYMKASKKRPFIICWRVII